MPKFTTAEGQLVKNIVATSAIKRILEREFDFG